MDGKTRQTLRILLDALKRESLHEHTLTVLAQRDAHLDAGQYDRLDAMDGTGVLWRGLIPAPSVRVSARWHSAEGGKVQPGERVSLRDCVKPPETLAPLATVGYGATVGEVTREQHNALMAALRADPRRSTVRITTAAGVTSVQAVSSLQAPRTREQAAQEATRGRNGSTAVAPEVTRYAALQGAQAGID